jgi:pimeloyl-ACP methyl ester carboxylesterase
MLETAGFQPPYVLVGHSFGGLVMRRFALLYPEEVAGVVLVDPMRCEEWPPLNPSPAIATRSGQAPHPLRASGGHAAGWRACWSRWLFGRSGKTLRSHCRRCRRASDATCWAASQPKCERCRARCGPRSPRTGRGRAFTPDCAATWSIPDTVREMHGRAHPRHSRSPCSRRETPLRSHKINLTKSAIQRPPDHCAKSEHWIHLDEPDLVINAIAESIRHLARRSRSGDRSGSSAARTLKPNFANLNAGFPATLRGLRRGLQWK